MHQRVSIYFLLDDVCVRDYRDAGNTIEAGLEKGATDKVVRMRDVDVYNGGGSALPP